MTVVLVIIGVALVLTAIVDEVWTTVAAGSGAGPVTGRISRRLWQAVMAGYRRGGGDHRLLSAGGVVVVLAVMATWIVLTLVGWSLVFNAADGAVRSTDTGDPADLVERLYFTGYTVFTLGNGELLPGAGTWQLATVLATGTGLILVTLSITYLVPVASAVAQRRRLASLIASLGSSPQEILAQSWTGTGFGMLDHQLTTVTSLIQMARQQHYAYPVLHYFHSPHRDSAMPLNLANLDEALLLLDHGVAPEHRPDAGTRRSLHATIGAFLETLEAAYIDVAEVPRPPPSLRPLADAGIPVVSESEFTAALTGDTERRRLLAGLLEDDGWDPYDRPPGAETVG